MAVEDFKNLIEVQSLEKIIKSHLDIIEGERNRLVHLEGQRQIRQDQNSELTDKISQANSRLSELENGLADKEKNLARSQSHVENAKTEQEVVALEKEISSLTPEIDQFQNSILEYMEEVEANNSVVDQNLEFINGLNETLLEIQAEVDQKVSEEDQQVAILKERIENLFGQTDSNFIDCYNSINKKFLYNSPLAFARDKKCSVCQFTITEVLEKSLENGQQLELCPGCSRLLTPMTASNL
ncbi:MAG: hypothetical protein HN509_02510 [Halobacteriovoraceae bacterium]|jgi:predicted  nucleic acid-binding Zn-ribbon protein|nr:hypothetical protein [Halobacteriovoraceae bacterium]MBT5093516.1 hypothetical protein [Halobacteriovoraceae bacterium]